MDEESEATLLTALTEILDNVDDENLSPFDTLPDSDLLSGQKGREHSPVSPQLLHTRLFLDVIQTLPHTNTHIHLTRPQASHAQLRGGSSSCYPLSPNKILKSGVLASIC